MSKVQAEIQAVGVLALLSVAVWLIGTYTPALGPYGGAGDNLHFAILAGLLFLVYLAWLLVFGVRRRWVPS